MAGALNGCCDELHIKGNACGCVACVECLAEFYQIVVPQWCASSAGGVAPQGAYRSQDDAQVACTGCDTFGFVIGHTRSVCDLVAGVREEVEAPAGEVVPGRLLSNRVCEECGRQQCDARRVERAAEQIEGLCVGMIAGGDNDQIYRHTYLALRQSIAFSIAVLAHDGQAFEPIWYDKNCFGNTKECACRSLKSLFVHRSMQSVNG